MAKVLPSGQGRAASAPLNFPTMGSGDSLAVLNAAAEDRRAAALQRQSMAAAAAPAAAPALPAREPRPPLSKGLAEVLTPKREEVPAAVFAIPIAM